MTLRNILITVLLVLFAVLSYNFITTYWRYSIVVPIDKTDNTRRIFKIDKGESVKSIASNLKEKELIRSKLTFRYYVKKQNIDKKIKAGRFILKKNMNVPQITDVITKAVIGEVVLTIPEGLTNEQIDKELVTIGIGTENRFLNCTKTCKFENYDFLENTDTLEGYLFPDTYFLDPETADEKALIMRMLNNFGEKITPEMKNEITKKNRTLHDVMIIASILEKEVQTEEDFAKVAGILWKRLDNGWKLETDATIIYVTKKNTISAEDLEIDSPYNTRKYKGLPPTPICNPGLSAIKAAINPIETPYWFYLTAKETDETIYATTNEEHEENKEKYL